MENGKNELRIFERDLQKDKHYILFNNGKDFHTEIGAMHFKYNYITIKMQLEIDRLKIKINGMKEEGIFPLDEFRDPGERIKKLPKKAEN